jgi:hypothetical protein
MDLVHSRQTEDIPLAAFHEPGYRISCAYGIQSQLVAEHIGLNHGREAVISNLGAKGRQCLVFRSFAPGSGIGSIKDCTVLAATDRTIIAAFVPFEVLGDDFISAHSFGPLKSGGLKIAGRKKAQSLRHSGYAGCALGAGLRIKGVVENGVYGLFSDLLKQRRIPDSKPPVSTDSHCF